MGSLNQFFGFSARQLRTLWWALSIGLLATLYLVVREFSQDTSRSNGLTIYVGGEDRTYRPVVVVDLNETPRDSLELVPGIGPTLASRIVAYRDSAGGFDTKEELMKVRGIGRKTYQRLERYITVQD